MLARLSSRASSLAASRLERSSRRSQRAPVPPPPAARELIPTTDAERAVIARATERELPPHLWMGLTLAAMRELVKALLLTDVVTQCNEAIPKDADGAPMYPTNDVLNGYVNQFAIKRSHPSESVCERLLRQGSPKVGVATVFVSWWLGCEMETLLDAIGCYLEQASLPEDTKFWVRHAHPAAPGDDAPRRCPRPPDRPEVARERVPECAGVRLCGPARQR